MNSQQRIDRVLKHIQPTDNDAVLQISPVSSSGLNSSCSDNDVVVVAAVRTAIGRAKRGALAQTSAVTMLETVLSAAVQRAAIKPELVDDICVGTVLAVGSTRANEARIAALMAGFPNSTCVKTVNRQCSSGLQAIADIAGAIRAGHIKIGIGAGVESMSQDPMAWGGNIDLSVKQHSTASKCLIPMGITSDNVANKFGISRQQQDELGVMSHARAANAIRTGRFKEEIVPVKTQHQDRKTGVIRSVIVDTDDGVRADTTLQSLAKLRPVFTKNGTTTAGTSSQVSDGAAASLLMSRATARELKIQPIAVLRSFAVAGVPPEIMGIGPACAIPKAIQQAGLTMDDIDLFEINEAFASQATYCVQKLGLSWNKVNVNGGAIALGHPLGCTGARMTATLLSEMTKRNARYGIVSMCIGSGMGAAAVYERV